MKIATGCLFLLMALCWAFPAAWAGERNVKMVLPGLDCARSELEVGEILQSIDGVTKFSTEVSDQALFVTFDDEKTSIDRLKDAIEKGTYRVKSVEISE